MGRPENPLPDAKTRILDAAERLFMENGYAATSVRMITGAAGVPVALVSYHFGSKQGLMEAVYERTLGSRGGSRVSYLDRLEADAGGQPIPVDVLVDAFLSSALRLTRKDSVPGEVFKRLIGRAFYEPGPASDMARRVRCEETAPGTLSWRVRRSADDRKASTSTSTVLGSPPASASSLSN